MKEWLPVVSIQVYSDLFSRVVKSLMDLAYRTKNIHGNCFSFSRANYTLSVRNFCVTSMLTKRKKDRFPRANITANKIRGIAIFSAL